MGNSLFAGGSITIDLENNVDTFVPGQMINGTVNVEQKEPYAAKKLIVSFIGSEHTFFDESNKDAKIRYRNDEIVQRQDYDLLDL
jgi:hypothetical protein